MSDGFKYPSDISVPFFFLSVWLGRVKLGQEAHQIARNKSMKLYGIGFIKQTWTVL
jgi:hypothetical protein